MSSTPKKIAIIGGGISGLTLTYRLTQLIQAKKLNAEVHLFEKNERFGGIIQTEHKNGFTLEKGPDGFIQQKTAVYDLAKDLGIEKELIITKAQNRRSMILQNDKLVEVPDGFYLMSPSKIIPFLKSPLLSWKGKIRTLLEPFIPAKENEDEESLADFVRRRFGRENLEKISQAMLGGIYTADPEQLSMQAALPRFSNMEKQHGSILRGILKTMAKQTDVSGARYGLFGSFKNGMSTLVNALVAKIPNQSLHANATIEGIAYNTSEKKWKLRINAQEQDFDVVYFAIAPHQIAKIMKDLNGEDRNTLQSVPYASSAILHFGFKASQIKNKPAAVGFIVPHREKKHFIACSFMSDKYENRAPADHVLIRVFAGGALQENLLEMPIEELRTMIFEEVCRILGIEGKPVIDEIAIWPNSMPQYILGHLKRIQQIKGVFFSMPNAHLLGNAYHGVGIPDLVEQANDKAKHLFLHI